MATYTPLPRKRGPMPGGKKARDTYDLCHRAWRAGVLQDWYYGKRSPSDPTIVWELEGVEYASHETWELTTELNARIEARGISSIEWGEEWIGYRSVVVTYRNGAKAVERLHESTQSVVVGDIPERMAGHRGSMVWRQVRPETDSLGRDLGTYCTGAYPWELVEVSAS